MPPDKPQGQHATGLATKIVIGMVVGVLLGLVIDADSAVLSLIRPVGAAFLRLIQMVIIPLVFASLFVGVAGLTDASSLGRLGLLTLVLYLSTTAAAVVIGLTAASLLKPGAFLSEAQRALLLGPDDASFKTPEAPQNFSDTLLAVIPTNPVASLAEGDMLQVIFFALVSAIALTSLKEERRIPFVAFFEVVQDVMTIVVRAVMMIAPFGVAALLADVVAGIGVGVLGALAVYTGTVLFGLLLHTLLVYGGLLLVAARYSPIRFLRAVRPAILLAFSTSSSSATLPVTLHCARERLNVDSTVASFVLPLGSTMNMDGTALYQGVAAVFLAQLFGVELSVIDQLAIVGTATAASVGAAGVPGAGMITLAMVLNTVGVPPTGIGLILGVDRLLDMVRTAVNVVGDLTVTTTMSRRYFSLR